MSDAVTERAIFEVALERCYGPSKDGCYGKAPGNFTQKPPSNQTAVYDGYDYFYSLFTFDSDGNLLKVESYE